MIIVCPECQSRYNVPSEVVSVEGREMKCAKCSHQWFQEGAGFDDMLGDLGLGDIFGDDSVDERLSQIEETLIEETGDEVYENAPESIGDTDEDSVSEIDFAERDDALSKKEDVVEPPVEKVSEPAKAKPFVPKRRKKISLNAGVFSGAFVGLLVFIVLFITLLFMKDIMMERVSFTKPLYAAMGFKVPVVGEGLVFDAVETSWKDSKLRVQGQIVNLQTQTSVVPRVELAFIDVSGDVLDRSIFSVESSDVEGEGAIPFEYEIQAMPSIRQQTYSVKLSFLPPED